MVQRVGIPLSTLQNQGKIEYKVFYNSLLTLYTLKREFLETIANEFDILLFQRIRHSSMGFVNLVDQLLEINPNLVIIHETDDIFISNASMYDNLYIKEIYERFPVICSTAYWATLIKEWCPLAKVYLYNTRLPHVEKVLGGFAKKPTILHFGTSTHFADVNMIDRPLNNMMDKYRDLNITFWGNDALPSLDRFKDRIKAEEYISDYNIYMDKLFNMPATISIHPLRTTRFNMCKSAIKYLECGLRKLPALFSPIPEYISCVTIKELLVKNNEWESKIDWLLSLPPKNLSDIGETMYEDVMKNWVLREEDVEEYYGILVDCMKVTKGVEVED
jgi:hypothetical protein